METVKTQPFTLVATVKAQITILENKIEILENTVSNESEIKNGYSYECSTSTHAGDNFDFSIDEKKLKLKMNNELQNFTRVSGESKNILGSWNRVESDASGSTTVTLTFTQDKMELNVKCYYN